jgi:diguanylate cyclase (GGDEF)-like protein
MQRWRFLWVGLLASLLWSAFAEAAVDPREIARMLSEAEHIRSTDKPKSQQLLDAAKRMLTGSSDPLLLGTVHMLECRWADDPATAYRAFAAGMPLAERAGSKILRAKLKGCRGNALEFEGRSPEAEAEYLAAISLASEAKDGSFEVDMRANAAFLQYNRGAMGDALSNTQAAYRISTQLGDEKRKLDALSMMANVYADAKVAQYDRAIEYYQQLVGDYEKLGLPKDVADMLYNIGRTYETKDNQPAAELYYRRSLARFQALKSQSDIAYTRCALGSSLTKQGRPKEALSLLNASLAWYETQNDQGNIAFVKQFRGFAWRKLGHFDAALRDLAAAREFYEKEKNTRFLERNVDETALIYEQLGDWRNAYAFRKRHAELQQALAVERRDEVSSRLRVEFDAEKKEQENRALARENALRATALREAEHNQRLQFAVIALTALLAFALAALFWRQVVSTRRMRTMAMTDELTRLPNRRHILTAVELAFAEARNHHQPASLIMLDIDRFKRINDTYGHAAGDEILKRVARICRMTLRTPDQIGRIGGEEFLIVLHNTTTPHQAADIAERLRAAVERLDVSNIAADLQITISLGVFVTTDYDVTTAIAAADEALYRAKENGRNRVEIAV